MSPEQVQLTHKLSRTRVCGEVVLDAKVPVTVTYLEQPVPPPTLRMRATRAFDLRAVVRQFECDAMAWAYGCSGSWEKASGLLGFPPSGLRKRRFYRKLQARTVRHTEVSPCRTTRVVVNHGGA